MAEGSGEGGPLPDDYYYDAKTFAREPPPIELPASFAPLYHSFAFESHKRQNLHYLDDVRAPPLTHILRIRCKSRAAAAAQSTFYLLLSHRAACAMLCV